eukprot:scaffold336_cov250-Pinguiococcus_pyrenoidosus.AAC.14
MERCSSGVNAEDLRAGFCIWQADEDADIKPTRTKQRFVDGLGPIRGSHHHDARVHRGVDPVHLVQESGQDSRLRGTTVPAALPIALGHKRIDFVKEDHCRGRCACERKGPSNVALGLSDIGGENFRPAQGDEGRVGRVGHGFGQKRLAATGRPVQQYTARRPQLQGLDRLGMAQRPFNGGTEPVFRRLGAADVLPGHATAGQGDCPKRRCTHFLQRFQKIRLPQLKVAEFQPLHIPLCAHGSFQCPAGSLPHERHQVGLHISNGVLRNLGDVHSLRTSAP